MTRIVLFAAILAASAGGAAADDTRPGGRVEADLTSRDTGSGPVRDASRSRTDLPRIERWAKRDGFVTREEARRIEEALGTASARR